MISLTYIPSDNALSCWHLVEPLLARIEQNDITLDQMLDAVIEERMQLWIGVEDHTIVYAGLTQIVVLKPRR